MLLFSSTLATLDAYAEAARSTAQLRVPSCCRTRRRSIDAPPFHAAASDEAASADTRSVPMSRA